MVNKETRLGVALIVSGPSGAGKSTVCGMLREKYPELCFSVSCTTRPPRPGERDGEHYHFIGKSEFDEKIRADQFIEYAEVHGNFYGTLRSEIVDRLQSGMDILLDIDVQGAVQIRERSKRDEILSKCAEFAFIAPPSLDELESRLRKRGTESEEIIGKRLENARKELEHWRCYDYLIKNESLEMAVSAMLNLLESLRLKTVRLADSVFQFSSLDKQ